MASIILPPGSAPANPSEGELYYDNTAKQVKFRDNAGFKALGTADLQGEPHIITKKLFPAYLGKLLDDTTSHSGDYGTEQADGRMYYYTDIAGSKPIHDPRIGAHFGSQRHKFKSLQILEQETATHGQNIFSVDGREWCRLVGTGWTQTYSNYSTGGLQNDSCNDSITEYFEVVAYCNALNFISYTATTYGKAKLISIDGSADTTTQEGFVSATTPLQNRFVDAGSLIPLKTATLSLGIHTFRIGFVDNVVLDGIELIAQDTASASTKVQIQVPAQDVVSYGRKFSVSATAQHYDPFDGFSSGNATALEAKVNTATSLGLEKWLHSGTYYRPYNGMRVVKWIDENGAIKTSVTCMPPNAKSVADSSSLTNANAKANASVANDTFYPTFEAHTTSVNEDNLHEVAKTFWWREFGNGSANGGSGATWADASMLSATGDDISYCMDDGLTSLVGDDMEFKNSKDIGGVGPDDALYITFIGTGVGKTSESYSANYTIAQNLPYGTHILKIVRQDDNGGDPDMTIDGIAFTPNVNDYGFTQELTFYQPKRPLIPDSACVLADYMVFADFKPQTTAGTQLISKGVRRQNISRDVFFDETDGDSFNFHMYGEISDGFQIHLSGNADSDTSFKMRIPSFGTNYVHRGYQSDTRTKLFIGDTDNDSSATKDNTANYGSYAHLTSDLALGVYQFGSNAVSGQLGNASSFDIVTPIHTSHHYQSFETPFLHELIGGDRSMEQTNLICSSDGKSWDEITRDTSYIGNLAVMATASATTSWGTISVMDKWRGSYQASRYFNKYFAIAYGGLICLEAGQYEFIAIGRSDQSGSLLGWNINDQQSTATLAQSNVSATATHIQNLERGDIVFVQGEFGTDTDLYNIATIKKV